MAVTVKIAKIGLSIARAKTEWMTNVRARLMTFPVTTIPAWRPVGVLARVEWDPGKKARHATDRLGRGGGR